MNQSSVLTNQLARIGQMLNRWSAQLQMLLWGAGILCGIVLFAFSDLWAQFERTGRVTTWLVLVAATAVAAWRFSKAMNQKHTAEAVAAHVEKSFPQIDNYLINCL